MKDWKDVPHLFANGKFRLSVKNKYRSIGIKGYYLEHKGFSVDDHEDGELVEVSLNDCTLIARKIEGMTDEEIKKIDWDESLQSHYVKYPLEVPAWIFIYLLSIGCYPFDQSHFGETVIDINTL